MSMEWPKFSPGTLTQHQVEQLTKATSRGNLAVFGGSPGTGKSFAAAQVIRAFGQEIGYGEIGVAAPTGKAAVRLSEALNEYQIPLRATTWHSLLGVESADGDNWNFAHNRGNPLPCKVLVGDEMSMADVSLATSIFAARARDTKFLVIGDVNQLPPVGHGAPLRDMIRSGCVPYGELREIWRNEGGIVQACADIRDGRPFRCEGNLRHVDARGSSAVQDSVLDTVGDSSRLFGVNPIWDVQVLVAVNDKGDLCRRKLNGVLQQTLNPEPAVPGSPFRRGDKVVNLKNGWFKLSELHRDRPGEQLVLNDENKVYVANGELGEAVRVEPKMMHIRLSAPDRVVFVPRGVAQSQSGDENEEKSDTGCNWDLGYCLSVHKSQGSQWPVVVVVVDDSGSARQVCSREWIYTAISRAQKACYLVGPLQVAQDFARRTAVDKRKTFLAERIREAMKAF